MYKIVLTLESSILVRYLCTVLVRNDL